MKELLNDVLRQTEQLFEKIRVLGSDTGTRVESYTEDKALFLNADLKDVVPEFAGEFGLSNLRVLKKLLDFAPYKAEQAKLQVRRQSRDDLDYVAELVFQEPTGGSIHFKTINPKILGDRCQIAKLNWAASVTPSKAKITEVVELATMLAQVELNFNVSYSDGKLYLTIGGKGAYSHTGSVVLASDIACGSLPDNVAFRTPHLLSVLKNAGNLPCTLSFAEEGIASAKIETEHGLYDYVLRGMRN